MAWINETAVPFPITAFFSPIVTEAGSPVVYVADAGTEFWKYNLRTGAWTRLADTNYSRVNCRATLAISPDGTRLASITDNDGEAGNTSGRRIEIYTIATNNWVAGSQTPTLGGFPLHMQSLVWEDDDTIWAWSRRSIVWNTIKCIKYVISTDTWTQYAAEFVTTNWATSAAMNATDVYGIGTAVGEYTKYNIAGDNYSQIAFGEVPAFAYDKDKLWYVDAVTVRQGYIDTADDSQHDNQFSENTGRTGNLGSNFGVADDLSIIMAWAKNVSPWVMSEGGGSFLPLVQTNPATEIT